MHRMPRSSDRDDRAHRQWSVCFKNDSIVRSANPTSAKASLLNKSNRPLVSPNITDEGVCHNVHLPSCLKAGTMQSRVQSWCLHLCPHTLRTGCGHKIEYLRSRRKLHVVTPSVSAPIRPVRARLQILFRCFAMPVACCTRQATAALGAASGTRSDQRKQLELVQLKGPRLLQHSSPPSKRLEEMAWADQRLEAVSFLPLPFSSTPFPSSPVSTCTLAAMHTVRTEDCTGGTQRSRVAHSSLAHASQTSLGGPICRPCKPLAPLAPAASSPTGTS